MSYQALYRKYRPVDLDSLVGQEHITTTLKNAIMKNKISHGYLFTGPRGTGKTSSAKIIARALNCTSPVKGNPCGDCESCKLGDKHPDIIEIDAASNNGVDEIRDIRDKVRYTPSVGKYKIYIIDEVHMLTEAANNAFLKTLEEPPEHAIFILATTDAHKVLPTVKSRCQRYDFRRIATPTLISRMEHVVREEKASVNREALEMIARLAQGGMRDALSLLDQVLAYALEDVNIDHVIEVTGGVSLNHLFDLVTNVYNRDIQFLIQKVNTLIDLGKDPMLLVDDLTLFYRDLLLLKTIGKEVELNRVILDEKIESFIDTVPIGHLQSLIKQWNEVKAVLKVTSNPKASLEIALVDMTADHPNGLDSSELLALKKEITELRNLVQKDLSSNKVLLQEAKEIKEPEETIEVQPEDDNGTQHDSSEEIEPEIHQLPDVKESNVDFLTQLKEDLANSSVPEYVEVIDAESVEGEVKNNEGNSDSKWIVSLMEIGDKEARSHLNAQREQLEKTVKEARMTAYTILKESEIGLVTAEEVVMIYPTKSKAKVADRVGNSSFIMGAIEDILGKEMNIKNIDRETWNVALSSFKSQTA